MKLGRKQKKAPFKSKATIIRNHKSKNISKDKKGIPEKKISAEDRLKKLEELFHLGRQEFINLFRECPEALVYTNIDGSILYANHCFELLTGYREEDLKGNSIVYCLKPEEKACFESDNREYFETTIIGDNDTQIKVSVNKRFNQTGNRLAGIMFSFRDIYQHMRERKIKQVLYHISQIAGAGIPLQEIYSLVHEQLGQIIDTTNFYIALKDTEKGEIDFPYYTDEAAGDNEIFINRYCTSHSIFHYVLKIGKPVLMDFQRYRKMLSYGYIESWDVMTNTHLWLAVPLKIYQKVIGVIALQSYNNARLYSEKDIELLEFVSQQLSSAIYRKILERKLELPKQEQKDMEDTGRISVIDRLIKVGDEEKRKDSSV
ncbi:MAG: GAF domain-containing protein [Elusimicrobiota bacterium]